MRARSSAAALSLALYARNRQLSLQNFESFLAGTTSCRQLRQTKRLAARRRARHSRRSAALSVIRHLGDTVLRKPYRPAASAFHGPERKPRRRFQEDSARREPAKSFDVELLPPARPRCLGPRRRETTRLTALNLARPKRNPGDWGENPSDPPAFRFIRIATDITCSRRNKRSPRRQFKGFDIFEPPPPGPHRGVGAE
jgi:hypothetical protein